MILIDRGDLLQLHTLGVEGDWGLCRPGAMDGAGAGVLLALPVNNNLGTCLLM